MSENISPFILLIGSRDRKATGRLSSPKQERQRGQNPKPSPAQTDRSVPACSRGLLWARLVLTLVHFSSNSVPPLRAALRLSGCSFQLSWRHSERKDAKLPGQEPEVLRGSLGSHWLSRSSSETSRSLGVFLRSVPARGAKWVRCKLSHANASASR